MTIYMSIIAEMKEKPSEHVAKLLTGSRLCHHLQLRTLIAAVHLLQGCFTFAHEREEHGRLNPKRVWSRKQAGRKEEEEEQGLIVRRWESESLQANGCGMQFGARCLLCHQPSDWHTVPDVDRSVSFTCVSALHAVGRMRWRVAGTACLRLIVWRQVLECVQGSSVTGSASLARDRRNGI